MAEGEAAGAHAASRETMMLANRTWRRSRIGRPYQGQPGREQGRIRDTWSVPDVILPVLNEAAAIPWVIRRMPTGFHPIVVDNGSTDGSAEIARSLGVEVVREERPGFGAACFAGLAKATADVVCFMDCDLSLDPIDLPYIAHPIEYGTADLSLGSRLAAEPGAWPVHARLANWMLAWEVRRRTGIQARDLGPMRAARREALLSLDIQDRRFGWPLEMVLLAHAAGWRIVELPVPYRPREGRSKVTGTLRGTVRAVRDMSRVLR